METVPFMLGSDPELMLRDIKTKKLRSAIPVIPEGKGGGRLLDDTGENRILHDNVLVEFNHRPAASRTEFVATIGSVLRSASKLLAPMGLELHLLTSANFPKKELKHPEARLFGCDPDYDAYRLVKNETPTAAAMLPFRSTGGHLHIGKHEQSVALQRLLDDPYGKVRVVKALDIVVGITSIFLDKDPTAAARRGLYGKAGCHRPTNYGVEYRACSPWWLASPEHTELVHMLTECALPLAIEEKTLITLFNKLGGGLAVQDIVNGSDVAAARKAYEQHIRKLLSKHTREMVANLDSKEQPCFQQAWGF